MRILNKLMRNIRIIGKQLDTIWLLCIRGFIRCIGKSKRIIVAATVSEVI